MQELDEEKLKEDARKISVREASFYSISDGFGLRYITPFAAYLGLSNTSIGFLTSIPSLLGNLIQIPSIRLMEKFSRKKIVFFGVFLQALMWLGLILLALFSKLFDYSSSLNSFLLISIYTSLIVFGAISGPAWSSWMKDLVSNNMGSYFGKRGKIAGAISLFCMLIAGFILDHFQQTQIFLAFILLFSLAFIGRSLSAFMFTKQYEPKISLNSGYYFTFWQFLKKMKDNNFGRFTLFISLISFSTAISSPFFAIYLLKNLNLEQIDFGYIFYTLIVMSPSVTALLFIQFWGKFADKYGNLKVMQITGHFIPLIPFFWVLSYILLPHLSLTLVILFLIIEEAFSGFVWVGFNLSAGNYIYDAVTRERMAVCVAYYSALNGIGVFFGATIGGYLSSLNFSFFTLSSLMWIFILSGILRFFTIRALLPKINEVRQKIFPLDLKQEIKEHLIFAKENIFSNFFSFNNQLIKLRPSEH